MRNSLNARALRQFKPEHSISFQASRRADSKSRIDPPGYNRPIRKRAKKTSITKLISPLGKCSGPLLRFEKPTRIATTKTIPRNINMVRAFQA